MSSIDRYSKYVDCNNYNITIDGLDFVMEDPQVNEAFNRRELARHDIIGGTQHTIRTVYKVREYSFKLHLRIDPLYPDIYNDMLSEWENKPCEIICDYMGGKFNAEVVVKPVPVGNYLEVDVQVIEIPSVTSTIPNESLDAPSNKRFEIISTSSKDLLKSDIKSIEKEIKQLSKKPKTKKNRDKLKKLKDELKKLQGKLKDDKGTTNSTTEDKSNVKLGKIKLKKIKKGDNITSSKKKKKNK